MRWVRPDFTTSANERSFERSAASRWASAGSRSTLIASTTARWIADGKTSLEDCDALTWSLAWTAPGSPRRSAASVAMTSLAFMLDEVPEPVWNTSTGNSASQSPEATSSAAAEMASASRASTCGTSSRSALTRAASPFTSARARIRRLSIGRPEMGKFSTARWVWAEYLADAGTITSPIESCSTRDAGRSVGSPSGDGCASVMAATYPPRPAHRTRQNSSRVPRGSTASSKVGSR